ncbi:MAG: CmcI family methyltransferase [Tistlia sp.]|uniref:CmcI family methyltransferase n=1 Tax=Tistlia sp. TaxID=3057121 RepID=UPI0034A175DD
MKFEKSAQASRAVVEKYRSAWKQSLSDWVNDYQSQVVRGYGYIHWRGVPIVQAPQDLWTFQEILMERQPEVVVEIGSAAGGLTQYLADLLSLLGGERRVVSIDISRVNFQASSPLIHCITAASEAESTVSEVAELCRGRKTLIIHDGNHRAEAVYQDLLSYSDLVTPGQYYIVTDGIIDLFKEEGVKLSKKYPGPLVAVEAFLEHDQRFRPDLEREKFAVTYNPMSFLERIA